jgi:hypothetical protein
MTRKTRKRAPPTTMRMARIGVTVNSPTLVKALSDSVIRSEKFPKIVQGFEKSILLFI